MGQVCKYHIILQKINLRTCLHMKDNCILNTYFEILTSINCVYFFVFLSVYFVSFFLPFYNSFVKSLYCARVAKQGNAVNFYFNLKQHLLSKYR